MLRTHKPAWMHEVITSGEEYQAQSCSGYDCDVAIMSYHFRVFEDERFPKLCIDWPRRIMVKNTKEL